MAGLSASLQFVERAGRTALRAARRLAAKDRQEPMLNTDQVVEPTAQLFVIADG